MLKIRVWIRAMFGFSQSETNGFLILIPLSLAGLLSAPIYNRLVPDNGFESFVVEDSLVRVLLAPARPVFTGTIDPNTASDSLLAASGLNPSLAKRMVRYRGKGAVFRKKEDLLKVFGMDTAWVQDRQFAFPLKATRTVRTATKAVLQVLDLNLADTLQLQLVKGIGPGKARRIVAYREALGGFVRMEQLREVYGLDSVVCREVSRHFRIAADYRPRLLGLNSATWEELSAHPYISKKEAIALVAYRTQHNRFDSVGQITSVRLIMPERAVRMRMYLTAD